MYDEIGLGLLMLAWRFFSTRVGLRRSPAPAGRNVCKWTVVRVEKQAAWCRQIGSFPWWPWQIGLLTARLWTPVTLPFLTDRAKLGCVGKLKSSSFHSIIFIGKSWGLKNHPWSLIKEHSVKFKFQCTRTPTWSRVVHSCYFSLSVSF